MDFHTLKRRDLQALSKKNNIPANITNAAMADALAALDVVEGVEEFLRQSESGGLESPERSVTRTSTRQKAPKEELEGSKLATTTRTRCSTRRRAVEGTDTLKTSTTRTTRKRATQEASIEQKTQKDLQAKFEEDLEQSDVSENNGLPEISEVSEVSKDQEESQNDPKDEAPVNDDKDNVGGEHVVNEAQEVSTEMFHGSQKVDFHSLSRKELQILCKKNKIPANTTNAAMADNLDSLESVEGLDELLEEHNSLAAKSPEMSRMTSSRVRQARTTQKTTRRKPAHAGSALGKMETVQKEHSVVQSLAKKMETNLEDTECPVSISTGLSALAEKEVHIEACLEKSEVLDCVFENSSATNGEPKSISEEVSDESVTSIVVEETGKELQNDVIENKFEGEDNKASETEEVLNESNASIVVEETGKELQDDVIENKFKGEDNKASETEEVLNESDASIVVEETGKELQDDVVENKFEGGENKASETEVVCDSTEESVASLNSFGKSNTDDELKPTAADQFPADVLGQKESNLLETKDTLQDDVSSSKAGDGQEVKVNECEEDESISEDKDGEGDELNSENLVQLGGLTNEIYVNVFEDMGAGELNFADDFIDMVDTEEGSKPETNCATTQADAPTVKGTPLAQKSMRKLKKMLKEKLQATGLEKKMDNLTLKESEIPLDSSNSDVELTKEVKEIAGDSENVAEDSVVDAAALCPVNILLDHQISEDAVVGHINCDSSNLNLEKSFDRAALKESDQQMTGEKQCCELVSTIESDNISCPPFTPSKSSRMTPKTPKSAARRSISVLDINKENIDNSASRTGPGKVEISVAGSGKQLFSAMSMGKLKKEYKTLQSEKKRPALQSRSENQCPLASP